MKKFILIWLLLLIPDLGYSQSLSVFNVETSAYPKIKAKFYAFDGQWNQITNLSLSNFTVLDNGNQRTVTNVSCPLPIPPVDLSSVLVIDISGSMAGKGLYMAQAAAATWVNSLPLGKSECAITSFSDENYFNQDFTTDKQKLLDAINGLQYKNGTNYNAAFINLQAGGIIAAKTGLHKRVIVFLSDGGPNFTPDIQNIISQANLNHINIYCVIIGFQAPDCVKQISAQTGGTYFENITTEEQAKTAYLTILKIAQGGDPCTIEWQAIPECQVNISSEIKLDNPQVSASVNYIAPDYAYLNFQPLSLRYKNIPPGTKIDSTITITAHGYDFDVSDIKVSNPLFDINPKSFILKQDQSLDLKVSYTAPADSSYQFCRFELINNVCSHYFFVSVTNWWKPDGKPTIRITKPNGGEEFLAGSDTVITWEGVTPQDTVKLEYSSNNGATWHLITNVATGLKYNWSPIPKITGRRYLVRATEYENPSTVNKDTTVLGMGALYCTALSNDGKYLASAGGDGKIYIWDIGAGTIFRTLIGHTNVLNALAFGPDNNTLISGGYDSTARIWDINSETCMQILRGHKDFILSVAYSQDGRKVATGSFDGTIKIWDINTGYCLYTLKGDFYFNIVLAFSPDGKILATCVGSRDITLYDVSTGTLISTLGTFTSSIFSLVFSNDGKILASGSYDNKIKLWDMNSYSCIDSLVNLNSGIRSLSFNSDASKIASACWDSRIRIWDIKSRTIVDTLFGNTNGAFSVYYLPDNSSLITGSEDNIIRFWDIKSSNIIKTFTGFSGRVFSMSLNPDGKTLACGGDEDNNIYIWDINSARIITTLQGHTAGINSVAFSPDSSTLASGSNDFTINLWDTRAGTVKNTLNGHTNVVTSVAFSPTGDTLASGSHDFSIKLWDVKSGQNIKTLYGHKGIICAIAYSPDGRLIASGSQDQTIKIWDLSSGKINFTIKSNVMRTLAFNFDGTLLTSDGGMNNNISIIDVKTGSLINNFKQNNSPIGAVKFSPNGFTLAGGGYDCIVKFWDLLSGDTINNLYGHTALITSLDFNKAGDILASGSLDGTCIIWNLYPDKPIQQDASDSTFAIISPQGQSKDIDMGKELVGSTKDSVISDFIFNLGTFPLTIEDVRIKGGDSADFLSVTGSKPFTVDVGKSRSVEFLFIPKAVGVRQALIEVETMDSLYSVNIRGEGIVAQLTSLTKIIDFGKVPVGAHKDTLMAATIMNTGSVQMQITNTHHTLPNDKDFTTIAGGGAFTLNPGDTAKLSLRFTPSGAGRTSGGLAFDYNGTGTPMTIQLYGEGIIQNIPKCLLMSGSMEADAGDYIEIPIILQNSLLAAQAGCNEVQTDLNFNSTLLYPYLIPDAPITNNVRTLHLSYPITSSGNDTLGTVSMVAALGNAEATVLMLENPEIYGGFVTIDTLSGIFKLKHICKEGGTRLINPDGIASIAQINPNPSSENVELKIILKEKGRTSLEIINMLGEKVATVFDSEMPVGENDLRINTLKLESGTYYFILRTPSETITQKLIIMK